MCICFTPVFHNRAQITPNGSAWKGISPLPHSLLSPLAFCAPAYTRPLCNDRRYPYAAPLTLTAKRPGHTNQSRLPTHMRIPDPTGNNRDNKNNDRDSWLDHLVKETRAVYTELTPTQQFYTQIIYITVVVSGTMYMGATLVRVYSALLLSSEFGL